MNEWIDKMKVVGDGRVVQAASDQLFYKTSVEFIDLVVLHLTDSDDFNERLDDFAERVVRIGWPVTFVITGLQTLGKLTYTEMKKEVPTLDYLDKFETWMTPMINQIIQRYDEAWERTVSLQKIALQELTAPVIPVFDRISVMPLVGTIDTERARLIMENLLNGIVKHRSEVVLIDITGVPVVDTMVAHHIIQAANAVRLVGCKCMLVGIRPEIAQTMVTLGINLSDITTTSNLRKGIAKALQYTDRKIVDVTEDGK